jgi:hypothetical protein
MLEWFVQTGLRLINKVFVGLREGVGRENGRRLHDDLSELLEGRPPGFVGEPPSGDLDHRDPEAPDVGSNVVLRGIALRVDPLRLM